MSYTRDALKKQINQAYVNYEQAIPGVDDIDYLLNTIIELERKLNSFEDGLLKHTIKRVASHQ